MSQEVTCSMNFNDKGARCSQMQCSVNGVTVKTGKYCILSGREDGHQLSGSDCPLSSLEKR